MKVGIVRDERADYCRLPPFHPSRGYPEYPFSDTCNDNPCYGLVRELFHKLGMDGKNYGSKAWSPLSDIIRPGNRVFIKPNFVGHHNPAGDIDAMITHGSVIRAVLDYACIALNGSGSITIGDAPPVEADFSRIVQTTGLDRIVGYYRDQGIKIQVVDMRKVTGSFSMGKLIKQELSGDPLGYTSVDLKADSELAAISGGCERFRANNYSKYDTIEHHNAHKNEYCIPNSILQSDVILNLPKLKTHYRTGITCSLKNMVGINGDKSWIPHCRAGSPEEGGDEYERRDVRKRLYLRLLEDIACSDTAFKIVPLRALSLLVSGTRLIKPYQDDYFGGGWHGNDTLPRAIADLNKIIFYADRDGRMAGGQQRTTFVLVDGIIAGEKEGPQTPAAKKCGILVGGSDPLETDLVCSHIMGFDPEKIPTFKYALNCRKYQSLKKNPGDIDVIADGCICLDDVQRVYGCRFTPPRGWEGHVELNPGGITGG